MKTHFNRLDVAIVVCMIVIGILGWSTRAESGFYVDAGVGYLHGLEYEASASIDLGRGLELRYTAQVETLVGTGFFMFRGGYENYGWHVELQTTGVPQIHYETFTIYHRWRF